jgi:hypothetical protein
VGSRGPTVNFGWDIARWLAQRFPRHAEIDSFDAGGMPSHDCSRPRCRRWNSKLVAAAADDSDAFLDDACAGRRGSRLTWLVAHFARLPCSDALRELLFDSAKPFITIRLKTRSYRHVRALAARTYFHRRGCCAAPTCRRFCAHRCHRRGNCRNGSAGTLSTPDVRCWRRSDAKPTIALAYPGGVAWREVGRGAADRAHDARRPPRAARFARRHDAVQERLARSVTAADGRSSGHAGSASTSSSRTAAASRRCSSRRRSASSARRFGVRRFVVEPSQFGGTNLRGLRSGAFWFYYRLGLSAVDRRAAMLAGDEFTMAAEPGYRTPIPSRGASRDRISSSSWTMAAAPLPQVDAADLSLAVTRFIGRRYRGDRTVAEAAATRIVGRSLRVGDTSRWPDGEQQAFRALSPLIAQIADLGRWPESDRRTVLAMKRAKGGDEFRFHRLLQRSPRLKSALEALAARVTRGA